MTDTTAETSRAGTLGREELIRLRYVALAGLVVLNVLDLLLTRELLGRGGVESNPLMVLFIGGAWGIAIKLGVPVLVGFRHLRREPERKPVLALCWVNVLYLSVVAWNFQLLVHRYA